MAPQGNKKKVGLAIALVLASPLLAAGLVVLLHPQLYWCPPVTSAKVLYNGKPSVESRLYPVGDGSLILRAAAPENREYWMFPRKKKVYCPIRGNIRCFSFAALVLENAYGVDLDFTIKSDVDPKIVVGQHFIEFTSLRKQRVHVFW